MNLPVKTYTETDIARAKRTGKFIGWVQAGAVVIGGSVILNLLGWIPTVLAVGAVSYAGYKWMTRSSKDGDEDSGEDSGEPDANLE